MGLIFRIFLFLIWRDGIDSLLFFLVSGGLIVSRDSSVNFPTEILVSDIDGNDSVSLVL